MTDLEKATIKIENNLIIVEFKENATIDREAALSVTDAVSNMVENKTYGLIIDATKMHFINNDARKHFGARKNEHILATALLITSAIQRSFANLYLRFGKSTLETKLFTEEEKARNWLAQKL